MTTMFGRILMETGTHSALDLSMGKCSDKSIYGYIIYVVTIIDEIVNRYHYMNSWMPAFCRLFVDILTTYIRSFM